MHELQAKTKSSMQKLKDNYEAKIKKLIRLLQK